MKLPNAERAFIDIEKFRDYCLYPQRSRGKNKARVFASALGLTTNDSEFLRDAVLEAILSQDAETGEHDEFGQRYTVDFPDASTVTIRSAWIIRTGEDFPRLTTCYIL